MDNKMREAFEEEMVRLGHFPDGTEFTRDSGGKYINEPAQIAWEAWQAALSQVEQEQEPVYQVWELTGGWRDVPDRVYKSWQHDRRRVMYTRPQPATIPEGFAVLPRELTAENGAKYAMIGEFKEPVEHTCSACAACMTDPVTECEYCQGNVTFTQYVTVSWTTIKEIWRKGVDHFSVAPSPTAQDSSNQPEQPLAMVADKPHPEGLYEKYTLARTDGRDAPGSKHENCTYYVLDLNHDPHAAPALRAYAESCRETLPVLASDLLLLLEMVEVMDSVARESE